jgi:ADP-ribose pyrophosphatase YjhB (NUDIX family)
MAASFCGSKEYRAARYRESRNRCKMQREFPEVPLVGVGAILVHEGRLLLIRRGSEPMKGRWSIPGGLVELGEELTTAVRRECLEETGLTVEPVALVELLDRIHHHETRVRYHYVIADYLCRLTAGEPRAGSDAAEVYWAEPAEWRSPGPLNLDPVTTRVLEAGWQLAGQLNLR